MMIKVKTLTGKEIEVDIDGTDKIERIKERVEEKEGNVEWIPPPYVSHTLTFLFIHRHSATSATTHFRRETDDGR